MNSHRRFLVPEAIQKLRVFYLVINGRAVNVQLFLAHSQPAFSLIMLNYFYILLCIRFLLILMLRRVVYNSCVSVHMQNGMHYTWIQSQCAQYIGDNMFSLIQYRTLSVQNHDGLKGTCCHLLPRLKTPWVKRAIRLKLKLVEPADFRTAWWSHMYGGLVTIPPMADVRGKRDQTCWISIYLILWSHRR